MTIECMIDLETFGLPPNGLPISIGAVKFNPETREIIDRLHVCIDPDAQSTRAVMQHFTIDPGTVKWWMHEDRGEARDAWNNSRKFDLPTALAAFVEWYADGVMAAPKSMPTWGNAVTFDVVLLKHALETCMLPVPWKFWDERCHRTLKTICPAGVATAGFELGKTEAQTGVLHSALFDAEVQAIQNGVIRRSMHPFKPVTTPTTSDLAKAQVESLYPDN